MTAAAHAQGGLSASLRVNFGSPRHWTPIHGTNVEEIPSSERPNYDMFRYGGSYYAYSNNRWYQSPRESGEFVLVDERSIPHEFWQVPRDHWRSYPQAWDTRGGQYQGGGSSVGLHIQLGTSSVWSQVHGTRVEELPPSQRTNYDVFRYGGMYYAHDQDHWYSSRDGNDDFIIIDEASVPTEFYSIPRDHWRYYPSAWSNRGGGYGGGYDNGGGYGGGYDNRDRGDNYDQPSATLIVRYGRGVSWRSVRGTRVLELRGFGRPAFDFFRYGGRYYAYDNDQWYTSRRSSGYFMAIDDNRVPQELMRIPESHWRNYPPSWLDADGNPRGDWQNNRRN